jgi:hypothetical protein
MLGEFFMGLFTGLMAGMVFIMLLTTAIPTKYATRPNEYDTAVKSCVQVEWVRGDEFKCKPITGDGK